MPLYILRCASLEGEKPSSFVLVSLSENFFLCETSCSAGQGLELARSVKLLQDLADYALYTAGGRVLGHSQLYLRGCQGWLWLNVLVADYMPAFFPPPLHPHSNQVSTFLPIELAKPNPKAGGMQAYAKPHTIPPCDL